MQLTKIVALALGCVLAAPAGAAEPDPVGVARPDGVGAMIIRNGKAEALRTATPIYLGDQIVTGVRGGVKIAMKNCAVDMASFSSYSVIRGCGTAVAMRAAAMVQEQPQGALAAGAGAGAASAALPVVGAMVGAWLVGAVSVATAENPGTPAVPLSP